MEKKLKWIKILQPGDLVAESDTDWRAPHRRCVKGARQSVTHRHPHYFLITGKNDDVINCFSLKTAKIQIFAFSWSNVDLTAWIIYRNGKKLEMD